MQPVAGINRIVLFILLLIHIQTHRMWQAVVDFHFNAIYFRAYQRHAEAEAHNSLQTKHQLMAAPVTAQTNIYMDMLLKGGSKLKNLS